ncbi:twin-arginine translocase TatA/TatE family subunit [Helicobacter cynogastricus]|uniref:twin-arginine translocase TatA/TatE family subunit n=1 Tax=Helicobacter cynogastricus TaxID=329937 RepID=UPI000CF0DCFD|nr:twin-arginine translocase TatA/TatE family subunit [Helicobacter cynogastricus]
MGGFTSVWHWLIVLFVILLLFGAKKIPELAKGLGSGIKNFKKAVKEDEEPVKPQESQALHNNSTPTPPTPQQDHKA